MVRSRCGCVKVANVVRDGGVRGCECRRSRISAGCSGFFLHSARQHGDAIFEKYRRSGHVCANQACSHLLAVGWEAPQRWRQASDVTQACIGVHGCPLAGLPSQDSPQRPIAISMKPDTKRCARLLDAIASRSAAQCCSTSQCTHHSKAGLRAGPTDRSLAAIVLCIALAAHCTQLHTRFANRCAAASRTRDAIAA